MAKIVLQRSHSVSGIDLLREFPQENLEYFVKKYKTLLTETIGHILVTLGYNPLKIEKTMEPLSSSETGLEFSQWEG